MGTPRRPHSANEAGVTTLRQIGGCGRWYTRGRSAGRLAWKNFPWWTKGSSVQARVSTSSASALRSRLSSLRSP